MSFLEEEEEEDIKRFKHMQLHYSFAYLWLSVASLIF